MPTTIAYGHRLMNDRRFDELDQGSRDLARRGVDIGIGEPALAAQVGQRTGEALGEAVKHPTSLPGRCDEPGVRHLHQDVMH